MKTVSTSLLLLLAASTRFSSVVFSSFMRFYKTLRDVCSMLVIHMKLLKCSQTPVHVYSCTLMNCIDHQVETITSAPNMFDLLCPLSNLCVISTHVCISIFALGSHGVQRNVKILKKCGDILLQTGSGRVSGSRCLQWLLNCNCTFG